jgi:hypothetical protein
MHSAEDTSGGASETEEAAHSGLGAQLGMIVRALRASSVGKTLIGLIAATLVIVIATAYGQIVLNRCPVAPRPARVSGAARHLLSDRRPGPHPQCGAEMVG